MFKVNGSQIGELSMQIQVTTIASVETFTMVRPGELICMTVFKTKKGPLLVNVSKSQKIAHRLRCARNGFLGFFL